MLPVLTVQPADSGLTPADRKYAARYLAQTQKTLLKEVKGLSDAQLAFRSAPDRWSIAECIEHIALTEAGLFQVVQGGLQQPAEPAKRAEIKVSNEEIIARLTNRTGKAQAPEFLKPTGRFGATAAALAAFQQRREASIAYVRETEDDLRNHFAFHPVTGVIDCYQMLILTAAHQMRHTLQIQEILADPAFPAQ